MMENGMKVFSGKIGCGYSHQYVQPTACFLAKVQGEKILPS
jgi:hypothetical protein